MDHQKLKVLNLHFVIGELNKEKRLGTFLFLRLKFSNIVIIHTKIIKRKD
jgi:hypothetical protein